MHPDPIQRRSASEVVTTVENHLNSSHKRIHELEKLVTTEREALAAAQRQHETMIKELTELRQLQAQQHHTHHNDLNDHHMPDPEDSIQLTQFG
jgi:TolA-binding protein